MDNLENIIAHNREKFNEGTLPDGHKDRFLKKMDKIKVNKKKINRLRNRIITVSSAAIIILALSIFIMHNNNNSNWQIVKIDTSSVETKVPEEIEMNLLEKQIKDIANKMNEADKSITLSNVSSLTFEAIPLSEQLPKELSQEQKALILKKYYKQKVEGLKKIKVFLAEQNIQSEE